MNNRFEIVEMGEASAEARSIYEETMKEMGVPFVLNWFNYKNQ